MLLGSLQFHAAAGTQTLAARDRVASRSSLAARQRHAQAPVARGCRAGDRAPDKPTPWPAVTTQQALRLEKLSASPDGTPEKFFNAAREELAAVLSAAEATAAEAAATTGDGVLAMRIKQVQEKERRRQTVEEILGLMAKRSLAHYFSPLEAVPIAAPADGATFEHLVKLTEHEMGAITEMEAYLSNLVPPMADLTAICRLDRTQGAQLYLGAMQFAYFVASIFSKIRSSESSGEGPLQMHPAELQALSKRPRTEEAWAVAQGRAAALWRLHRDENGRFSQLNEFSTRVSLAPSAAVGEFFEPPAKRGQSADRSADGADTSEAIPAAELLPMQTGTLKARD